MATITIGNHSKIVASPAEQDRIRSFYRDVLGCTLTKQTKNVDYFRFHEGFFMAVLYQEVVARPEELRQAIWLELRTDEPVALRDKILAFGVHSIEMPGAEHLYFQAPGGQVFRVVGESDDLGRFER
jgi:catechol 2,3-dioxygenase-like lactoylglutathione lyase family enzyme